MPVTRAPCGIGYPSFSIGQTTQARSAPIASRLAGKPFERCGESDALISKTSRFLPLHDQVDLLAR